MQKCIFATHTFSKGKCSALPKMHFSKAFDAKMHLMQKCKFSLWKMFSITFYEVKCSASHFPKENVQLCKNAVFFALQKTKMRAAKMHFCQNAFDTF